MSQSTPIASETPVLKFVLVTFTLRGEANLIPGLPIKGVDQALREIHHKQAAKVFGAPERAQLGRLRADAFDTGDYTIDGVGPCNGVRAFCQDRIDRGYVLSGVTQELREAARPAMPARGGRRAEKAKAAQYRVALSFQNPDHPEFADQPAFQFRSQETGDAVNRLLGGTWSQVFIFDNRGGGSPSVTVNLTGFLGDQAPRYAFKEVAGGAVKLAPVSHEKEAEAKPEMAEATAS